MILKFGNKLDRIIKDRRKELLRNIFLIRTDTRKSSANSHNSILIFFPAFFGVFD